MPLSRGEQKARQQGHPGGRKLIEHPLFAPSVVIAIAVACLGAAFNLGQQWNRQEGITEIKADLKHRESVLPADAMAREYELARQHLGSIDAALARGGVRDAEIGGHIENLAGKLDSVWLREAEDRKTLTDARVEIAGRLSALEAALDILRKQIATHEDHDFQIQKRDAH
jgi:hypothetical protein